MITGLIFEGPQVVSRINYELVYYLKKDGFTNISQAVGTNVE
jgi:dihydroorotate dehydrogenase